MEHTLRFSAFVMNASSHIIHGGWRLPEAQQHRAGSLELWVDLARTLDTGGFDVLFFADVVGLNGDHRGGWDCFVESGAQIPVYDPVAVLSALAWNTDHLGLAATSSIIQAHPFAFARTMSTLDHASGGRVAWNIVTSTTPNAYRNFGHGDLLGHDERYRMAEEYVDVAYKLWEGSWDDDALVQDKRTGRHADPAKVHKIHHAGPRYRVEGPHLVPPSPQRTPFLFQAGSSPAGRRFAATHAEAQFIGAPNPAAARRLIADTRALAAQAGRDPADLSFFQGKQFVVASTESEARRQAGEIDDATDDDAVISFIAGVIGLDLGHHDLDDPIGAVEVEGSVSMLQWIRDAVPDREPTVRDLAHQYTRSGRIVGTPEQIADELGRWRDAGVGGINVTNAVIPGDYVDFCEHVMPVLRARGLAAPLPSGQPATLRRRLTGRDRLLPTHPAARHRGAFSRFAASAR